MRIRYVKIEHPKRKVNTMDIPWGAWVKEFKTNDELGKYDIIGIYDTVIKEHKADYPFYTDLRVVLACFAPPAERNLSFKTTLVLLDMDARVELFRADDSIDVPEDDMPKYWYESFVLYGVGFDEPGKYSLSVLVDNQEKLSIPLLVFSPMGLAWDEERGTKTKFWPEDFKQLHDDGKI